MDTPIPSPVNTDSGLFSPSSESTASSPRGMSAIWTIACKLKLKGIYPTTNLCTSVNYCMVSSQTDEGGTPNEIRN